MELEVNFEESLWAAKAKRESKNKESREERRILCGHGDNKMNLNHWRMRFGVKEDECIGKRVHEGEVSHDEEEEDDMATRIWNDIMRSYM